jgi:AcrR family transcriptional regulator
MAGLSSIAAPRRRPDTGGYARGEETRARIIAAALQVFGEEGYARASTRHIADAAGVNPPALQYYFDSKEGLHRACAEFIIDRMSRTLTPTLEAAREAAVSGDKARMLEALCDLLDALVDFCIDRNDADGWSRFMGRGQVDDAGPAFPLISEGFVRPLHEAVSRLTGPLIGRPADDDETRLRTIYLLSPLAALHINRAKSLAHLVWTDFNGDRRDKVKSVLRAHTRAALALHDDRGHLKPAT